MRKVLQIILVISITANIAYGQPEVKRERMERIHAAKMAYITDRLQLTSKQSTDFVPLYNEYEKELRAIRQPYLNKCKNGDKGGCDDAHAREIVDDNLDYQQEVIGLKRKYTDRFTKVISAQQLTDLYKAEREFRQILKKRLEERRGMQ